MTTQQPGFSMSQYASRTDLFAAMIARITDLEAQLEAIGAGGVSGPLIGQPQAMPDLSQLTERGAKAWAGVDAQGLREGFTAADMATASAQGFRGGAASVDVAQERPTPEHIEAMQRAWLWMENQAEAQSKGSHATFDLMMLRDERDALRAALAAGQATAAPAQPAAQQGAAYAELEKKHADFVETVGLMLAAIGYKEDYARQWPKEKASVTFRRWFDEQRASRGQAPAGAAEELALTRQTNLAVVQRLQAKINALEAELDASRKAESQVQSYADDLDRRAQYDADNLADACGGYGGERI